MSLFSFSFSLKSFSIIVYRGDVGALILNLPVSGLSIGVTTYIAYIYNYSSLIFLLREKLELNDITVFLPLPSGDERCRIQPGKVNTSPSTAL